MSLGKTVATFDVDLGAVHHDTCEHCGEQYPAFMSAMCEHLLECEGFWEQAGAFPEGGSER